MNKRNPTTNIGLPIVCGGIIVGLAMGMRASLGLFLTPMSVDTDIEVVQRDHYAIVDACRERDADKVAALVERHIQETRREVMAVARTAQTRTT